MILQYAILTVSIDKGSKASSVSSLSVSSMALRFRRRLLGFSSYKRIKFRISLRKQAAAGNINDQTCIKTPNLFPNTQVQGLEMSEVVKPKSGLLLSENL